MPSNCTLTSSTFTDFWIDFSKRISALQKSFRNNNSKHEYPFGNNSKLVLIYSRSKFSYRVKSLQRNHQKVRKFFVH